MQWILLVLAYGICKGIREILKKKALEISSTIEVLFLYTFISFLIVTPEIRNAGGIPGKTLLFIAVKSFVIFIAWMAGFTAVKNIPVGLYGLLDQSRVIFSMLLGVIVLQEALSFAQVAGLLLVIAGLVMLKFTPGSVSKSAKGSTAVPVSASGTASVPEVSAKAAPFRNTRTRTLFIVLTLVSAFLNAVSGLFDKMIMSLGTVTDGQLQFWYMLFLVVYYLLYIVVTRPHIHWSASLKNYWIWILAILFVIADRFLFMANAYPESRVTIMTLTKQSCVIVTIIGGRLVFKEQHFGYRLLCALTVIAGITLSVLL